LTRNGANAELASLLSGLFGAPLGRRLRSWSRLFEEIRRRGYTGSFSHLERLWSKWRCVKSDASIPVFASGTATTRAVDPATGNIISPIVTAALCINLGHAHSSQKFLACLLTLLCLSDWCRRGVGRKSPSVPSTGIARRTSGRLRTNVGCRPRPASSQMDMAAIRQ